MIGTYDEMVTRFVLDDAKYQAGSKRVIHATNSISRAIDSTKASARGLGTSLSLAVGAMATGMVAFLGFAAKADADMDRLNRSLTAVAGSSEEAKKQFKELLALANKSPVLDLQSAVGGAIALQSTGLFGFGETKSIMDTISNAVAFSGGGIDGFQRVLVNLQQIAGQGKLTGDELRETASIIPSFRKAMQDAFPSGTDGLTGVEVIRGVVEQLRKLPEVGGGVQTAFDNMGSAGKRALGAVGSIVNSVIVPAFESISTWLNNLVDSGIIDKIGKKLTASFDGKKLADVMITGISYVLAAIELAPAAAAKMSRSMVDSFGAVAQSLGLVAAVLGAIFLTSTVANIVAGVRLIITVVSEIVMAIRAWGIAQLVVNAIATKGASLAKDFLVAGIAAAGGYAIFKGIESLLPKVGAAMSAGLGLDEIGKRAAEIKAGINGGSSSPGGSADPGSTKPAPVVTSMDRHLSNIDRSTAKLVDLQNMILGGGAVTEAANNAVNLNRVTRGGGGGSDIDNALFNLGEAIKRTIGKNNEGLARFQHLNPRAI